MKTYVHKHPAADTLASVQQLPDDAPAPAAPWDEMTTAALKAWCDVEIANGWSPPAPPQEEIPSPVPEAVTPLQIRRALNTAGLRATVEAAVQSADQDVKDAWDFALEVRRDNALLTGMAAQLGMTSEQIDDLFRLAASYT